MKGIKSNDIIMFLIIIYKKRDILKYTNFGGQLIFLYKE